MSRAHVRDAIAGVVVVVAYAVAIWLIWPVIEDPIQALWNANLLDVPLVQGGDPIVPAVMGTVRLGALIAFAGLVAFSLLVDPRRMRADVASAVLIAVVMVAGIVQFGADSIEDLILWFTRLLGDGLQLGGLLGANVIVVILVCGGVGAIAGVRHAAATISNRSSPVRPPER